MTNLDEIEIDGITYGLGGLTIDLNDSEFGEPNQIDADTLGGKPASDYLLKSEVYPVGSIYISLNSTNPSSIFGGTWEQIQGRFLLGVSSSHPVNQTGGEEKHTLTNAEMPKHNHNGVYYSSIDTKNLVTLNGGTASYRVPWGSPSYPGDYGAGTGKEELITGNTGGGAAHNNMPPYLAVYMWKRTA